MAPTPAPFRLSATLAGHSADVRSLTSPSSSGSPTANAALFSSSRDGTARSWVHDAAGSDGWKEGRAVEGAHEGFVNAVVWLSGGEKNAGFLVTAGQDKLIHIYPLPSSLSLSDSPDLSALKPTHTLIGHDNNVCALGASSDGERIVSGSWDKTAMVWKDFQLAYTLSGHAQAVWAVLPLDGPDDLVLTGAADNLIKLWRKDKEEITFKGHTQAVRALAKLDKGVGEGDLFASAGNDATIRLWSLSRGDQIHVLNGHDSFVYSLAAIPDAFGGGLVSGGEDRTMRVWRAADGSCEQTIVIPAVSVWTVACLGNGDIAAGSSDGLIRVFTRQESRVADLEALTAFDRDVSTTALNSTQVGDVKKADLPGIEALGRPGEKDGAVKMIRSPEDTIQAYSWTSATSTWQQIGEVVDAVGSNRKQLYMGHEYDHVFDVDFKDGAQPLKLPYNVTMNPYEAAQRFLQANELPAEYTDQVVQFIERSTAGVTLGTSTSEYVDPYTGASRYTGGGSGSTPAPMTGGFAGDPYTGGGATAAPTAPSLLPHKTCLSFTAVNLPALRKKLGELNDSLAADPSTASLALNESDLASLELLVNARPGVFLAEGASAVASKMLLWPSSLRFPSIDLVRYVSLSTPLSETIPSLLSTIQDTSAPLKEQETNTMLAFRALANMFYTKTGKATMKDEAEEIIDTLKRRGFVGVSKNGKIALSTVVLNYSVIAVQKSLDASAGPGLFELVAELLRDVDGEVVYRSLVALGNLLLSPQIVAGLPSAGIERYKNLAKSAASRLPEARNKAVVVEIERVR